MSVFSIFFSPTGGTARVMDILAEELGADKKIDLMKEKDCSGYHFTEADTCLIGVPSYGGRVPGTVLERLRQMKADASDAVLVVVYGNRAYDDTLLELKNEMAECGFRIKAAVAAVAEHSIMRQFGAGRPDAEDDRELREFAGRIRSASCNSQDLLIPGNQPYREYHGVPFKPKAGRECSACGRCVAQCPVEAISPDQPSGVDEAKCISCMHCIAICPKHARKLNGIVLTAASLKMKKACEGRKGNELFI